MKLIKAIFNFYINSSIHVALAVYAMTFVTLIQFDLSYDQNVLLFVFFASITGYNFVKYFGLAKFHHRTLAGWLKVIQVFSAMAFVLMCYYLLQLNTDVWLLISVLGIITFLYAIPLIPKHYLFDEQKNLREVVGLKVYIIALVWSFVTVLIPVCNAEINIDADIIITLIQRFLLVIVLMLPFEIRDLNYDNLKLATIPQKIGVKKTKAIGALVLIIFFMLEFLKKELKSTNLIVLAIFSIVVLLFLLFSKKEQSQYYSSFFTECLPVFWLVILLLIR